MLEIGHLECVSYGVVCGMFYCVDIKKALINKDDSWVRELCVEQRKLVVETHLGRFWKKNFLNLCMPL
jgi:hypothetical protein